MSNQLFDAVARIARHESDARVLAAFGVVTEVHRDAAGGPDHAVTVALRDRGQVLPRVPVAVGALGTVACPAVGDLVVLVFAGGDIHAPVVVGRLHDTDVPPPSHEQGQFVFDLPPGGGNVKLVLDPSVPELTVRMGEDALIRVTGTRAEVQVGDASLSLDAGGSAEIKADVGGNTLTIGSGGEVALEAASTLKLKAAQIEIEGTGGVKINGATVELN